MRSVLATRKVMDPQRRRSCFELFGYDFILDEDFNTWLIEVNTNPCIEESSSILKVLLPRMIDDMLKLTIDTYFADFSGATESPAAPVLPVSGYPDDENLWECLCSSLRDKKAKLNDDQKRIQERIEKLEHERSQLLKNLPERRDDQDPNKIK